MGRTRFFHRDGYYARLAHKQVRPVERLRIRVGGGAGRQSAETRLKLLPSISGCDGLWGLEAELRALQKVNFGIDILQDMKLTESIYMRHSAGYSIWSIEVDIQHSGGISIARWC